MRTYPITTRMRTRAYGLKPLCEDNKHSETINDARIKLEQGARWIEQLADALAESGVSERALAHLLDFEVREYVYRQRPAERISEAASKE